MSKKLLFATTNSTKVLRLRELLKQLSLPLEVISLEEVNISDQITEDGNTPAENARKKAEFHYRIVKIPTLAADTGLYIDKLPKHEQPGLFVRQIPGTNPENVTDDEFIAFYKRKLQKIGGKSKGTWITAVALMLSPEKLISETFSSETMFTAQEATERTPGEPLNALQIDVNSGKYFSEMTLEERTIVQGKSATGIIDFIVQCYKLL